MFQKRKVLLINRPFQLKMTLVLSTWVTALAFIYPTMVYYSFESFANAFSGSSPEVTAFIDQRKSDLMIWIAVAYFGFAAITFFLTLLVSHRIAGPVFKLNKFLANAAQGDFTSRLQFRKNDYFHEMADSYNHLMDAVGSNKTGGGKVSNPKVQSAKVKLSILSEKVEPSIRQELEDIVASLNSI